MRRVELVMLTLVICACSQRQAPATAPEAVPANAQVPAPALIAAESQQRLVRITRFDCVKAENNNGAQEFPWAQGLSHWPDGGPGGAAWNASKLYCAVEFQPKCTKGSADIELRVGGTLIGTRHATISHDGLQLLGLDLDASQWTKHLDQSSPVTKQFPYRTATFSASIIAACELPEKFGPSLGPRLEFADDRHFTIGFANGE